MSRRLSLLYFKEVSADLQTEPLLTGLLDAATRQLSDKYQVGSLIRRGERAHMPLDHGPCVYCFLSQRCPSVNFFPLQRLASSFFIALCKERTNRFAIILLIHLGFAKSPHTTTLLIEAPIDGHRCCPLTLCRAMAIFVLLLWHPDLSLFVSESGPTNLLGLIDIRSTRIPCFFV